MSETVQIVLIGAAVFMFALWMFKDKLGSVIFKGDKKGMNVKIERYQNSGITISGVKQDGEEHKIDVVTPNATIQDVEQTGKKHTIHTGTSTKK